MVWRLWLCSWTWPWLWSELRLWLWFCSRLWSGSCRDHVVIVIITYSVYYGQDCNYYDYDCGYDCHYNVNFAYLVTLIGFRFNVSLSKSLSSSHPFSELCSEMHQRREASAKFMPGSLLLYKWENPKLLQSPETLHIYDRGWMNTLCGNRTKGLNGECVSPGVSSYNKYASEALQYRNSSERPISTMASMVIDPQCDFPLTFISYL